MERQEQSVLEKSCRSISATMCAHACLYVVYGVYVVCVDVGVSVGVDVHLCVLCTSRSGMDWSSEARGLARSFLHDSLT